MYKLSLVDPDPVFFVSDLEEQKAVLRIRWHFGTDPDPRIRASDYR